MSLPLSYGTSLSRFFRSISFTFLVLITFPQEYLENPVLLDPNQTIQRENPQPSVPERLERRKVCESGSFK